MTAGELPAVADGLRPHVQHLFGLEILLVIAGNEADCLPRLGLCYFDSGAKKLNRRLMGKKHANESIKSKRALNPDTMKAFCGHPLNLHDLPVRQKGDHGWLIFSRRFVSCVIQFLSPEGNRFCHAFNNSLRRLIRIRLLERWNPWRPKGIDVNSSRLRDNSRDRRAEFCAYSFHCLNVVDCILQRTLGKKFFQKILRIRHVFITSSQILARTLRVYDPIPAESTCRNSSAIAPDLLGAAPPVPWASP